MLCCNPAQGEARDLEALGPNSPRHVGFLQSVHAFVTLTIPKLPEPTRPTLIVV
jgi:hypothetical protein